MKFFGVILLAFAWCADAGAQPDSLNRTEPWHTVVLQDVGTFWNAFLHVGGAPARWNGESVAIAGGMIVTTGITGFADGHLALRAETFRGRSADRVESVVRMYGEIWFLAAACGGSYAAGIISRDRWLRETAFLAGSGLILTATATQVVKYIAGRSRPYLSDGPGAFRMFAGDEDHHSFPSGHTAAAFSVSAVLAHQFHNAWATAGLYTLATLTSLSRVYANEHWFSDCVFSAMLSTAITHSLLHWYDQRGAQMSQKGLHVVPTVRGIAVVYAF